LEEDHLLAIHEAWTGAAWGRSSRSRSWSRSAPHGRCRGRARGSTLPRAYPYLSKPL